MKKVIYLIILLLILSAHILYAESDVQNAKKFLKHLEKICEKIVAGQYEKARELTIKYFKSEPEKMENWIDMINYVEACGGISFCPEETKTIIYGRIKNR